MKTSVAAELGPASSMRKAIAGAARNGTVKRCVSRSASRLQIPVSRSLRRHRKPIDQGQSHVVLAQWLQNLARERTLPAMTVVGITGLPEP